MRGGALPPALLLAALGLALGSAPARARAWGIVTLSATVAVFPLAAVPPSWLEAVFLGCWVSTAATAASVHLPHGSGRAGALAFSLNAGVWTSAVVALSGSRTDLLKAAPCILLCVPAAWLVARGASIAVKVASSWLIAIAVLVATLPFLHVTPGYLPDHLE